MAKSKNKKQMPESFQRPKRSKQDDMEREEEMEMAQQQMGNINVPDRSGVSSIRDRGR